MSPKEMFTLLSLWILNLLPPFYPTFSCLDPDPDFTVFGIRIRIQKAPEYGTNTDKDPQHFISVAAYSDNPTKSVKGSKTST